MEEALPKATAAKLNGLQGNIPQQFFQKSRLTTAFPKAAPDWHNRCVGSTMLVVMDVPDSAG